MSVDKSRTKRIARRFNLIVWSVTGFFLAGYLPAVAAHGKHIDQQTAATISFVLAAMGVIPYASRIAHPLKSALAAGALGTLTGVAMVNALSGGSAGGDIALKYVLGTGGFCALIGATFGHLAKQRRQRAQDEWKRYQ